MPFWLPPSGVIPAVSIARTAPERPEIQDTLGKARLATGDARGALRAFDRSIRLYREVVETTPKSWDPRSIPGLLAEALVGRALARLVTGDTAEAREDLDEALTIAPETRGSERYRTARTRLPD